MMLYKKISHKKMLLLSLSLSIMALPLLQGCAAPGVKPEDANILQAAGNLGQDGEFQRQTNRKYQEVQQSQQEVAQAQARFDALKRNSASLQRQKQQLDREYWAITQKNIKLEQAIQVKNGSNAIDKRKQLAAQRKLNSIKQQTRTIKAQRARFSTQEYKKRIATLNRDIKALENEYLAD